MRVRISKAELSKFFAVEKEHGHRRGDECTSAFPNPFPEYVILEAEPVEEEKEVPRCWYRSTPYCFGVGIHKCNPVPQPIAPSGAAEGEKKFHREDCVKDFCDPPHCSCPDAVAHTPKSDKHESPCMYGKLEHAGLCNPPKCDLRFAAPKTGECCEKCDESFGGGSTMLSFVRKCGNLDCPCHSTPLKGAVDITLPAMKSRDEILKNSDKLK